MRAVVVYESLWGNTAVIARAIAAGIGPGARAMSTTEAAGEAIADLDLIVAGAPLLGFSLPTESMLTSIGANPGNPPEPPDLTQPSMSSWLERLPHGTARSAAFETRIWWSPGSAAKKIAKGLESRGYPSAGDPERFIVTGKFGPLKPGEVDRARAWGAVLARTVSESD